MARMETGGEHFEDLRLEARVDGDLAERAQAYLDATGDAKAELVRDALNEYLPDSDSGEGPRIRPPATDDLQTSLHILQQLAEPNGGTVPRDVALSELAQQFSRSTSASLTTLVNPLEDAGYVKTRGGLHARKSLRVVLPSDVPAIIEAAETPIQSAEDDEEHSVDYDDPENAGEVLDALQAAGLAEDQAELTELVSHE